jgi:hypothetical protein
VVPVHEGEEGLLVAEKSGGKRQPDKQPDHHAVVCIFRLALTAAATQKVGPQAGASSHRKGQRYQSFDFFGKGNDRTS